ncbi:hypothetical protein [Microbulbifer spongiae]|uniref:Sulfotransferase domain-containing protein n=1 Tax=Microbulbifer spongiae TaxID=2944933 RepID=A0ABY9EBG5_9GAMM|nr:hypothetical protein [Microbulbifer sp. MI-G]WKD48799.1 hypothetical protein M8T91_12905 [Microbulbifer sp. MI-G]
MAKLYLHVGMPKTGTSFIQAYMNLNAERLKVEHRVDVLSGLYPHIIACEHISDTRLKKREDINRLLQEKKLSEISEKLKTFGADSVVICSSEYFTLSEKSSVLKYFLTYFDKVEVIYTVRRQDKLLASGFNQDVKALGRTSNLVWSKNDKLLNYYVNCQEWADLGVEISIINFDHVRKCNQNIEYIFLETCGVYGDLSSYATPGSGGVNYSLKRREVLLNLALNRQGIKAPDLMKEFIAFNNQDIGFSLPKHFERIVMDYYSGSNKRFSEEFCVGLDMSDFISSTSNAGNVEKFEWDPLVGFDQLIEFFVSREIK